MTRIIPQITNSDKVTHNAPEWLDTKAIMDAAHPEIEAGNKLMTKLASIPVNNSIISYACAACSKVYTVDNPELATQAKLASNQSKAVEYACPKCGSVLSPYSTITAGMDLSPQSRYAAQYEKNVDLVKTSSETYNTFADMHFVLRATDALSKFASKNGMLMARARYLKSEHIKQAGQEYPILNNIECALDWVYGRNQRAYITASIAYDVAGKLIYPKIFKTADGTQHPFEKEYIAALEKTPHFTQMTRQPKKTDLPTFRKPDITRFRAFASMDDAKEKYEKYVEKKKSKGKEPKSYEDWCAKHEAEASLHTAYQMPVNPTSQTPVQPQPNVQYQAGQQVVNPSDGKTYNVKTPTSGTGMVVTDPNTNQDAMIPQNQIENVKPAVQTQASFRTAEQMADELLNNFLKDEKEQDEIGQHMEMAENDVHEIQKAKNLLEQSGENVEDHGSTGSDDEQLVEDLIDNKYDGEPIVHGDEHANLLSDGDHGYGTGYFAEASANGKKKVNLVKTAHIERVSGMSSNWAKRRAELLNKQKETNAVPAAPVKTLATMNRQERFAADLGFSPDKTSTDSTGHSSVNNVPFAEKKDVEVGLTEYPIDHKKEDSVGYNENKGYGIPFNEMDENFLDEHEHFNNENKLPINLMERENLNTYVKKDKKDQNYGHSTVAPTAQEETKFALMEALGIPKTAEDLAVPNVTDAEATPQVKPVQFKELKTAPKADGYTEPETIPTASGKVSEAITKFENTIREIEELKKALAAKRKPLEDNLKEISKPLEDDITAKNALYLSYMNMAYDQLQKSEKQMAAYEKFIFAAYQRNDLSVPNVTLAQVIAKAATIDPKYVEIIKKIKAILENESTNEVVNRTLYKYPVSKVQEKKISKLHKHAELLDSIMLSFIESIKQLEHINTEFSDLLASVA